MNRLCWKYFVLLVLFGATNIYAQCPCSADLRGSKIPIAKDAGTDMYFSGAIDSSTGNYFMIWTNNVSFSRRRIRGALFGQSGNQLSAPITFQDGDYKTPSTNIPAAGRVLFDPVQRVFFVIWDQEKIVKEDGIFVNEIIGQFVSASGEVSGSKITIDQHPIGIAGGEQNLNLVQLIYNNLNREYVIAYRLDKLNYAQDSFVKSELWGVRVNSLNRVQIASPVLAIRLDGFLDPRIKFDTVRNRYMILLTTGRFENGKLAFKILDEDLSPLTKLKILASGKLNDEIIEDWLVYSARKQSFVALWKNVEGIGKQLKTRIRAREIRSDGTLSPQIRELPVNLGLIDIRTNPDTQGYTILHSSDKPIELLHVSDRFETISNVDVDCQYGGHHTPEMIYNPITKQFLVSWGFLKTNLPTDKINIFGRRFTSIPSTTCN